MDALSWVLRAKILLTLAWAGFPLLAPESLLIDLGFPRPEPIVWLRLLGAAYLALLVGYWLALQDHNQRKDVWNTIRVGIVSNGLGSLLLCYFGLTGAWNDWGTPAQVAMWVSAFAAGAVTLGLVLTRRQGQVPD
jgi:hypothetical protein